MQHVFGYGSLTFSPALPDSVIELRPAILPGHRRAFNKVSRSRSAPAAICFDPPGVIPPAFLRAQTRLSITLGTAPAKDSIRGLLATYGDCPELIAVLDEREGYDPTEPSHRSGYLPSLEIVDAGSPVSARVYLTNHDPRCPYTATNLSLDQIAVILIGSTPRSAVTEGPRARGLDYLEGTRRSLRAVDIVDPYLEALAARVRSLPGPWIERMAPVR